MTIVRYKITNQKKLFEGRHITKQLSVEKPFDINIKKKNLTKYVEQHKNVKTLFRF